MNLPVSQDVLIDKESGVITVGEGSELYIPFHYGKNRDWYYFHRDPYTLSGVSVNPQVDLFTKDVLVGGDESSRTPLVSLIRDPLLKLSSIHGSYCKAYVLRDHLEDCHLFSGIGSPLEDLMRQDTDFYHLVEDSGIRGMIGIKGVAEVVPKDTI